MSVKFTKEQQQAINLRGRSVCVSACAGSGKTSVLVERYKQLVMRDDVAPSEILAITFTDKAAHNMRGRLRSSFSAEQLPIAVQQLEGANIYTIHSFCKTLLSEYPFEAGLSSSATVMDEGAANILKMEVVDALTNVTDIDERYLSLMRHYQSPVQGKNFLEQILQLYNTVRTHGSILGANSLTFSCHGSYDSSLARLRSTFTDMKTLATKDKRSFTARKCQAIDDVLHFFEHTVFENATYEEILFLQEQMRIIGASKKYVDVFSAYERDMRMCVGCLVMQTSKEVRESLWGFLKDFDVAYTARKRELASLDFDDLLVMVHSLLTRGDAVSNYLCERLRTRFRHILLDECQDTNALQFSIIERIARDDNLFIVGDVRQSIYGFRGADVRVMRAQQSSYDAAEGCSLIPLTQTHRSTKPLVNFVNALLAGCACNERLVCDFMPVNSNISSVSDGADIEVHVTSMGEGENLSLSASRFSEATGLAKRFLSLVADGRVIRDEKGVVCPVSFGDIAVLFRSMTNCAIYEKVFRDYGIPYTVVKGSGFYSSREITDLIAVLRVFEYPHDDVMCATVLTSPLFALSDDALYWLGVVRDEKGAQISFFDRVRMYASIKELADTDRAVIQRFFSIFYHVQRHKQGMLIRDILEYVLDETGYFEYVFTCDSSDRICANIFKLQELAGSMDRQGAVTLHDFIAYIEDRQRHEIEEKEADIEVDTSQCVTLMTVHKAKGLEFPIVCVADMGTRRTMPFSSRMSYSPEYGLGLQVWYDTAHDYIPDVAFQCIKESAQLRDREEDLRILYVACTRAKDMLLLFGSCDFSGISPDVHPSACRSWIELVLTHLVRTECIAITAEGIEHTTGDSDIRVCGVSPFASAGVENSPCVTRTVSDAKDNEEDVSVERLIQQVRPLTPAFVNKESFTVSELVSFIVCPRQYYFTYLFPIPRILMGKDGAMTGKISKGSSADIGSLYHKIMQRVMSEGYSEKRLLCSLDVYQEVLLPADFAYLQHCVVNTLSETFNSLIVGYEGSRVSAEVPFIVSLGNGTVRGQIDLLCDDGDHALVVDYKTTAHDSVDTAYILQLELYAYACARLLGRKTISGAVYFPHANKIHRVDMSELSEITVRLEKAMFALRDSCFERNTSNKCTTCIYAHICQSLTVDMIERSFL